MIEPILRTLLQGNNNVTAIVGARIYPVAAAQTAQRPYVTYQRIATTRIYTHDGDLHAPDCLIQYDVWADSYEQVKAAASAIVRVLSGFQGSVDGVAIDQILLTDDMDLPPGPVSGAELPRHRVALTFKVHWQEAV